MRLCSRFQGFSALLLTGIFAAAAAQNTAHPAARVAAPALSPGIVYLPVSITDRQDRLIVPDLPARSFRVLENNHPLPLVTFARNDAPASIVIVLDLSGSMQQHLDWERSAVREFLKAANPHNEYCFIGFAERPARISGFTSSPSEIEARLTSLPAGRRTALFDAILFAIDQMQHARYARQAILLISDGGDNQSSHSEGDVHRAIRRAAVQVECIDTFDLGAKTIEERNGPSVLTGLADESGGRSFAVRSAAELGPAAARLSLEFRTEYLLGFQPDHVLLDGKWRRIKVKVSPPPGLPKLTVHARNGYYAPLQ
ncbi:MAG TPA: VWA domain-containing protein [Acidobacteriaceae bacterium]|jgi:Ca-activated chloride channel family protein